MVLPSGSIVPRIQGWLNITEIRLATERKSPHPSRTAGHTRRGIPYLKINHPRLNIAHRLISLVWKKDPKVTRDGAAHVINSKSPSPYL